MVINVAAQANAVLITAARPAAHAPDPARPLDSEDTTRPVWRCITAKPSQGTILPHVFDCGLNGS
jgi:hypothetical protein